MAKILIRYCLVAVLFEMAYGEDGIGQGTLRFYRNNETSPLYSSGIVQVYVNGSWGGICSSTEFGQSEANIICHQFGYSEAALFTTVGSQTSYGSIDVIAITDVQCSNDEYQVLFQCDYTYSDENECNPSDAVIVQCMSTRVWDDTFSGQIRLQHGDYSSEGLVEIFCNNRWGTVCDDLFNENSADTVCHQLGYTNSIDMNSDVEGNTSQPIWLTNTNCGSVYSCLTTCTSCPSSDEQITSCTHQKDANVRCAYDLTSSNRESTLTTCDITDITESIINRLIEAIVGVIMAFIALMVLCITIPLCVCYYVGVCNEDASAKA